MSMESWKEYLVLVSLEAERKNLLMVVVRDDVAACCVRASGANPVQDKAALARGKG